MKVVIFSDSHGRIPPMIEAVQKESPDMILHCGDNEKDCEKLSLSFPDIPVRKVQGNCDMFSKAQKEEEFLISSKRVFMTHGHLHGVKMGLRNITKDALAREVDILIFGHTHIAHYSVEDALTIINPGSIGTGNTYAVLEIKNGTSECNLMKI